MMPALFLEIDEKEVNLIESSVRTHIDWLSRIQQSDTPEDALDKHKNIIVLIHFLLKLKQHHGNFDQVKIGCN